MQWPEDKKCCEHGIFFFVIDSHDQLLTESKIKIYLDKYPNFASKAEKGCLFFLFFFF